MNTHVVGPRIDAWKIHANIHSHLPPLIGTHEMHTRLTTEKEERVMVMTCRADVECSPSDV